MWFLTAGPVVSTPMILAALQNWRSINVTNKSNSLTKTVASSLVCTSPLAVITVVVFLLQLFCWRSREYPFLLGKVQCSLVFFFELEFVFSKIPSLASGTSLLSFSLFMGPVLKFHSVGTSLMRNFDIYFPNVGPFFSRILAWRSVDWVTRILRIGPKTFCIGFHRDFLPWETSASESLWYTTQLWYTFYNGHSILVIAFSSFWMSLFFGFLFGCSSTL